MGLQAQKFHAEVPAVPPGIVTRENWEMFLARLRRAAAETDLRARAPLPFRKDDLVAVRREIVLGSHHIPNGAVGVITVARGNLFDVRFACDDRVAITLCKYDLAPAQ